MLTGEANELQLLDLRFGAASRHAPTWGNSNELGFVNKISRGASKVCQSPKTHLSHLGLCSIYWLFPLQLHPGEQGGSGSPGYIDCEHRPRGRVRAPYPIVYHAGVKRVSPDSF